MKNLAVTLLIAFALVGCSEAIPESRSDYVGHWEGNEMFLSIYRDGTVEYERKSGRGRTSINAPLKEFVGDDFVVGLFFMTTTFDVSEPPDLVDGTWQMVVDGVRLTRE